MQVLHHAAGGFAVRQAYEFNFFAFARAAHVVGIHFAAVGSHYANHLRTRAALRDHRHAFRKPAIRADDTFVAALQQVHDGRFNAAGAGRGNRIGDAILGLKHAAQHNLHVAHHFGEPGVHVTDERSREGAIDAGIHVGGARRQHQPRGGKQFAEVFSHNEDPRCKSYRCWLLVATSSGRRGVAGARPAIPVESTEQIVSLNGWGGVNLQNGRASGAGVWVKISQEHCRLENTSSLSFQRVT